MQRLQLFAFAVLVVVARAAEQVRVEPYRFDSILDGLLDALSILDRCSRSRTEESLDRCLESDLARTVEIVTRENAGAEYRLNRYLTMEVRPIEHLHPGGRQGLSGLGVRLLEFLDALQFRYRPEDGDGDIFEGRKKKKGGKKHKMGMMMAAASIGMSLFGGFAMKMMMGGVMMIAMKALIIAKIALLLSAIMAIKKLMNGGGGGIIQSSWGGGGGGGGGGMEHGGGGYRRSYGMTDDVPSMPVANAMAYKDQLQGSYHSNANYPH